MGEMLNDLIFSVNTILPVFIVVAIGYYMRRKGTVDASFVSSISNVVFYYALPARMFLDVAGSDFTELMNPRFILVTVGGTIGVFLLAWLVISHCIHDGRRLQQQCTAHIEAIIFILGFRLSRIFCRQTMWPARCLY